MKRAKDISRVRICLIIRPCRFRDLGVTSLAVPRPQQQFSLRSLSSASSNRQVARSESSLVKPCSANASIQTPDSTSRKGSTIMAYLDLAKAKLSALVVTTTAAGFVAAGGPLSTQLDVFAACLVGTALCSSSAAAWNQVLEVARDGRMKRTQQRPLVNQSLSKAQATTAATIWGIAGTSILYVGTDPVTTLLGVGNMALYAGLYTAMKPVSIYNTWVGAVVGAIPPVMGWSAATGGSLLDMEALILASMLYLWQMPHFFALSFMHRIDYKRGGFQMVPCLEEDGEQTAQLIVRYAWYLAAVPLVATAANVTSSMFALEGMALNAYALTVAHRFQRERTNANARKVFLTSLWYLPSLLMLFLLHSKVWDEDKEDVMAKFLSDHIHWIRDKGRELCLHEAAVAKTNDGGKACPVVLGTKTSKQSVEVTSAAVTTSNLTIGRESSKDV